MHDEASALSHTFHCPSTLSRRLCCGFRLIPDQCLHFHYGGAQLGHVVLCHCFSFLVPCFVSLELLIILFLPMLSFHYRFHCFIPTLPFSITRHVGYSVSCCRLEAAPSRALRPAPVWAGCLWPATHLSSWDFPS